MALPILDGNQTATTLSTILSSGAHIPAHTVVSLGSQAITDMRSAVSGSVVSISNLPATQTIAGTVTANGQIIGGGSSAIPIAAQDVNDPSAPRGIYAMGSQSGGTPLPIGVVAFDETQFLEVGTLQANVKVVNSVTASVNNSASDFIKVILNGITYYLQRTSGTEWRVYENPTPNGINFRIYWDNGDEKWYCDGPGITYAFASSVNDGFFYPPQSGWTLDEASSFSLSYENPFKREVYGAVTASVTNSVTVGSLPVQLSTTTIGGTSRLNVTLSSATTVGATAPSYGNLSGGSDGTNFRAILTDTSGRTVVTGSTSILGTPSVTFGGVEVFPARTSANVLTNLSTEVGSNYLLVRSYPGSSVTLGAGTSQIGSVTASVSGTVTANVSSTTVTVSALPSGALTTRFGSVTTANTSQLTSCVTNSSRKYLLAQNISAGTVTIGIGFSPTTTQGIQLTAGAGITFDSFCPTGAVWWLGATTGATWTILEG